VQVWLGKIGDLLDLKADSESLQTLEDTLRANMRAIEDNRLSTASALRSEIGVATNDAAGGREQLAERLSVLEDTVAGARPSDRVRGQQECLAAHGQWCTSPWI
jgi:hypothetical protein